MIFLVFVISVFTADEVFSKFRSVAGVGTFSEKVLNPGERRYLFHSGKTVADLILDSHNQILTCLLVKKNDEARVVEEKLQLFKEIGSDVKVVKLKLMDMLDLIKRCNFHPSAHKIQLEKKKDSQDENKQDFSPPSFFHSASSGIIPRTLWCGAGNIAKHFNHLGPDFQLDRCCRQHDFCPYDLPRLSTRNPTPYTQCFCKCDELFYNCLKDVGSTSADDVGKMFFNIVKMRCVDFVQPKKCSEWRDDDGCIEWEEDQESMPELVVVQPADRY